MKTPVALPAASTAAPRPQPPFSTDRPGPSEEYQPGGDRTVAPVAPADREAVDPEREAAERIDHEVHGQRVASVLRAAQAGLDEHEAGLHEHDQEAGDQRPHIVDREQVVGDAVVEVGESIACSGRRPCRRRPASPRRRLPRRSDPASRRLLRILARRREVARQLRRRCCRGSRRCSCSRREPQLSPAPVPSLPQRQKTILPTKPSIVLWLTTQKNDSILLFSFFPPLVLGCEL